MSQNQLASVSQCFTEAISLRIQCRCRDDIATRIEAHEQVECGIAKLYEASTIPTDLLKTIEMIQRLASYILYFERDDEVSKKAIEKALEILHARISSDGSSLPWI
jgi:hypothetical protein